MRYYSPAKVNLFLRVLDRRPDGYHELSSLFQAISIFDTLDVELSDRDCFTVSNSLIPKDSSNLVLKAVSLFRKKTGISQPFAIALEKRIPTEAGLGGGSSNAATTLWALNALCDNPATTEELMEWGAEIGSDVAFFFSGGTALCTGRGENITSLSQEFPHRSGWVVKPPYGLSTPAVYRALDVQTLPQRDPLMALMQIVAGELCYFNDLEHAAFRLSPELEQLKNHLSIDCEHVMMTGSGSAIFCIGDSVQIPDDECWSHPFSFVNRAPNSWYTY